MNETDVCKAFVKAAFANRPMPNYGLIDNFDKRELIIRNLLWEAAGFKIEDSTLRYKYALAGIKGKKYSLVCLYKVWSAFTKGLRYILLSKH